jgi:hypothetical protein
MPLEATETAQQPRYPWYQKAAAVLYAFFCFEIGVLLLLLPWVDLWNRNYLSSVAARWPEVWMSPYLRGAVSGLGVVDIAIAFIELVRLRRFARRRSEPGGSRREDHARIGN